MRSSAPRLSQLGAGPGERLIPDRPGRTWARQSNPNSIRGSASGNSAWHMTPRITSPRWSLRLVFGTHRDTLNIPKEMHPRSGSTGERRIPPLILSVVVVAVGEKESLPPGGGDVVEQPAQHGLALLGGRIFPAAPPQVQPHRGQHV